MSKNIINSNHKYGIVLRNRLKYNIRYLNYLTTELCNILKCLN